jgi:type III pantothenate kinase
LLDAGNTRIKWLVTDGASHEFLDESRQIFPTLDLQQPDGLNRLAQQLAQTAQRYVCQNIWICHVLGANFFAQLEAVLQGLNLGLKLRAPRVGEQGKLKTNYSDAARLGQDRWVACLALVGLAQQAQPSGTELPMQCVVSFGTATTIDAVVKAELFGDRFQQSSGAFVHLGGVIIPGLDLMRNSLHLNTAQLPRAQLQFEKWPTSTDSAIASGIIRAQWSAVQGFVQDLETQFSSQITEQFVDKPRPHCHLWVHGGHAEALLPFIPSELNSKLARLQDAVFHGLLYSMRTALPPVSNRVQS